jgi:hypothetical protein
LRATFSFFPSLQAVNNDAITTSDKIVFFIYRFNLS